MRTSNRHKYATAHLRKRNQVGRDLENLRADFLRRQQEDNKANPKKFWNNISSIFPSKSTQSKNIWLKDQTTHKEIESEDTADFINRYFTNIGPNLAKQHNKRWEYFGETVEQSIDSFNTNLEEVNKLCKDINIMKSSGIDEISSRLCKDAFMVLGHQLVHIFNCSLS